MLLDGLRVGLLDGDRMVFVKDKSSLVGVWRDNVRDIVFVGVCELVGISEGVRE